MVGLEGSAGRRAVTRSIGGGVRSERYATGLPSWAARCGSAFSGAGSAGLGAGRVAGACAETQRASVMGIGGPRDCAAAGLVAPTKASAIKQGVRRLTAGLLAASQSLSALYPEGVVFHSPGSRFAHPWGNVAHPAKYPEGVVQSPATRLYNPVGVENPL